MAETAMTAGELRDSLARARATIRNLREASQEGIQRGLDNLLISGGGATVGIMRGLWGDATTGDVVLPGVDIDADIVLGTVLSTLGVFGIAGGASGMLNMYGAGINAAVLARELEKSLRVSRAAAKK